MSGTGTATTADAGTATTSAAATSAASTATPWYPAVATEAGYDAEYVGTIQSRGLDKKTAPEAAQDFYKAHREATQLISRLTGTPDKDRILVRPKPDATEAEQAAFYQKLGRPEKPEGYDFKGVTFPDGTALDDNFSEFLRNAAFKANLPAEAANAFAKETVAYLDKIDQADNANNSAKLQEQHAALKKEWGAHYEAFDFVATQGAAKLGWSADLVKKMGNVIGADEIMKGLLRAGQAFGEDRYVANKAPGGNGLMTREQATARMAELRGDREWIAKYNKGDSAAIREFNSITELMTPRAA